MPTEPDARLFAACCAKPAQAAAVAAALQDGADPNGRHWSQCILHLDKITPLMALMPTRDPDPDPDLVRLLIANGAQVNRRSERKRWTALHLAAAWNHTGIVRLLLDRGAQADAVADDPYVATPLCACINANEALCLPTVHLLLERGANPNRFDGNAEGPLHKAVAAGNVPVLRTLLAAGADPDRWEKGHIFGGWTALGNAARLRAKIDVVETLLAAGAAPDAPGRDGQRALHEAAFNGTLAIVDALLAAGADLDAPDDQGRTALALVVASAPRSDPTLVRALLARGADPNAVDRAGDSLLHAAVRAQEVEIVRALLDAGADPNTRDAEGQTALERARERGLALVAAALGHVTGESEPTVTEQALRFLENGLAFAFEDQRLWFAGGQFHATRGRVDGLWNRTAAREHVAWILLHDAGPRADGVLAFLAEGRAALGLPPLSRTEAQTRVTAEEPALAARLTLPLAAADGARVAEAGLKAGATYVKSDKEGMWTWRFDPSQPERPFHYREDSDERPEGYEDRVDGAGFRRSWGVGYEVVDARLSSWGAGRGYLDQALTALGQPTERCWLAAQSGAANADSDA